MFYAVSGIFIGVNLILYIMALVFSTKKRENPYEIKTEPGALINVMVNASVILSFIIIGLTDLMYYRELPLDLCYYFCIAGGVLGLGVIIMYFLMSEQFEAYKDDTFFYKRLNKIKFYHVKDIDRIVDLGIGTRIYFKDGKKTSISMGTNNRVELIEKLIERHNALEEAEKEEANNLTA